MPWQRHIMRNVFFPRAEGVRSPIKLLIAVLLTVMAKQPSRIWGGKETGILSHFVPVYLVEGIMRSFAHAIDC